MSLINLQDGYMLKTNNVYIDLFEWEKKVDLLPELNMLTFRQWEDMMKLHAGRLLTYSENQLLESMHYRYVRLWKNIAYKMAEFYNDNHEQDKAEKWYLKICTNYEEEEKAHFKLMLIYDQLGLGLLVNHQYKVLENALNKLDIEMDPKIRKWYELFSKG